MRTLIAFFSGVPIRVNEIEPFQPGQKTQIMMDHAAASSLSLLIRFLFLLLSRLGFGLGFQ